MGTYISNTIVTKGHDNFVGLFYKYGENYPFLDSKSNLQRTNCDEGHNSDHERWLPTMGGPHLHTQKKTYLDGMLGLEDQSQMISASMEVSLLMYTSFKSSPRVKTSGQGLFGGDLGLKKPIQFIVRSFVQSHTACCCSIMHAQVLSLSFLFVMIVRRQ